MFKSKYYDFINKLGKFKITAGFKILGAWFFHYYIVS